MKSNLKAICLCALNVLFIILLSPIYEHLELLARSTFEYKYTFYKLFITGLSFLITGFLLYIVAQYLNNENSHVSLIIPIVLIVFSLLSPFIYFSNIAFLRKFFIYLWSSKSIFIVTFLYAGLFIANNVLYKLRK